MKVQIELPDQLVEELYRQSGARNISLDEYAAEIAYQVLATKSLGPDAVIDNRSDWQEALERSRRDLEAGRIVPHEKVKEWHDQHRE